MLSWFNTGAGSTRHTTSREQDSRQSPRTQQRVDQPLHPRHKLRTEGNFHNLTKGLPGSHRHARAHDDGLQSRGGAGVPGARHPAGRPGQGGWSGGREDVSGVQRGEEAGEARVRGRRHHPGGRGTDAQQPHGAQQAAWEPSRRAGPRPSRSVTGTREGLPGGRSPASDWMAARRSRRTGSRHRDRS